MKGPKSITAPGAVVLALVLGFLLAPRDASAQMSGTGVRGFVSDEQGQRLADVDVEIQYTGEGTKRTYHVKSNKKGGFVRIGLSEGPYKIYLTKDGYQKKGIDMWLSLGGLTDMCGNVNKRPNDPCEDLVMKKATVAVSIGGAGGGGAAGEAGSGGGAAAGGASGAATATPEEAAKLGASYAQAVEAIRAGQWDVAETALKEVLARIPDQPIAHFNLGHVYRQKKDWPAAEAEFKRVTELEPTKPDAFVAMAALYEAEGKGSEAVDFLVKNGAAFEQDARYQVALGATAMNQGLDKEAEGAFSRAATLDPSNVEVQYYLASLALNRNEVDDAVAHLEKYIAESPAGAPNVETAKSLLAALQAKKK